MTINEIAELAGVSVSTVSKIMNGKDSSISAETREHVLRIAKEYHYKPYASVMTSYSGRSLCIGVILRNAENIRHYAEGILTAAADNGYSVIFRESRQSLEQELKNITALVNLRVDGILWEPVSPDELSASAQLKRARIPYVFFNAACEHAFNIDFEKAGYLAAKALIQAGHTEIACLLCHERNAELFCSGCRQYLFEHGIVLDDSLIFYEEDGLPINRLASHVFSGIVVFRYSAAVHLAQSMESLHYTIPCDLSLVCLKEETEAGHAYPQLSSLTIPYTAFCRRITDTLVHIMEKKEALPPEEEHFQLNSLYSIDIPYQSRIKKVISLGSINIDNYMNFKELPHTGKTVTSPASVIHPGGKCINEAVGLAKLGHTVCAIGCVGDDADADMLYEYTKAYLSDISGIQRRKGQKTGQAYIFVQEDGNSMISIMSGANNALTASDIEANEHLFSNSSFCLMQTEVPMEALIKAGELAKKNNLITVLKPSACSVLPPELVKFIDILVPNLDELNEICPGSGTMEEKADLLLSHGIQTVIVTLGAEGCYIHSHKLTCSLPAINVVSVDSSGAGDAFICALVAYLLYGYDMLSAAKIATCAAGLSTTRQGTTTALVDRATLETYVQRTAPGLLH